MFIFDILSFRDLHLRAGVVGGRAVYGVQGVLGAGYGVRKGSELGGE